MCAPLQVSQAVLDHFDSDGEALLHPFRFLGMERRVAAAEYIVGQRLDETVGGTAGPSAHVDHARCSFCTRSGLDATLAEVPQTEIASYPIHLTDFPCEFPSPTHHCLPGQSYSQSERAALTSLNFAVRLLFADV